MSGEEELKSFIEGETAKQRYQHLVHELTEKCWDTCVDKPSAKMDAKTESCIQNCVNRFMDATTLIVDRLAKSNSAFDSEVVG
ncbi:mitochondrial import inner membrane translocase subunit Tim8, putative [Ixodes scapularis]|uniref:Mitochondrial import inner membrane translocase subunit n=1 Tax=Ixodes scapularis TaxID=6945 RepID=B7QF84_IXOSC|nr:mitochondrial import inner membrane translocase subunit Tim8, putative [Ixodes scapularis]|eukprot:XP_002414198.1 mitochondrial import inner membrane translocase subunit Tim8, putative [Ixodes scapularis]